MEPHTGLNNLDYVVLGVVLLSGLLALMRGFVREVLSLLTWAGAFYLAAAYYPLAEPWARRYIKSAATATDAAAVAVFIIAFIILTILSAIIVNLVKGRALTMIDRSLGFVFGLLRGALVACLVYLVATSILWPDIDKPASPPEAAQEARQQAVVETQNPAQAKAETDNAPDWLLKARTRPVLAYGASELKIFMPGNDFEKKTKAYLDQKAAVQHMIDAQTLENLSVPGVAAGTNGPAYDANSRARLDQLINQKGGSP